MSNDTFESVSRLTRDMARAAATLSPDEARYLVDAYYIQQENRKRTNNQVRALGETEEPHSVVAWLANQDAILEGQIKRALDSYTDAHPIGEWLKEITGIGPVIAAGLLAHIDITQSPTAGHIWRYCGLDPTSEWISRARCDAWMRLNSLPLDELKAQAAADFNRRPDAFAAAATKEELAKLIVRRPWNASLKRLCWLAGESFVKVSKLESDVYGKLYIGRKAYEHELNDRGGYSELAAAVLARTPNHAQRAIYLTGKLSDGHLHERAKRWAVKMFLSDLFEHWYRVHHNAPPPKPFAIGVLGHAHYRNGVEILARAKAAGKDSEEEANGEHRHLGA